jgi:hypothetical protein
MFYALCATFGCEIYQSSRILSPLQHLQPGGPGVFPTRRYEVTPCEGEPLSKGSQGLKPWAEFYSPFGARPGYSGVRDAGPCGRGPGDKIAGLLSNIPPGRVLATP